MLIILVLMVSLIMSFYNKIIYCYFLKILLIALTLFFDMPNEVMVNEILLSRT